MNLVDFRNRETGMRTSLLNVCWLWGFVTVARNNSICAWVILDLCVIQDLCIALDLCVPEKGWDYCNKALIFYQILIRTILLEDTTTIERKKLLKFSTAVDPDDLQTLMKTLDEDVEPYKPSFCELKDKNLGK